MSTTPGPWLYRPKKHDDWGWIRTADDEFVAMARAGRYVSDAEANEHRLNRTDPYAANARLIAAAPDMLSLLKRMIEHNQKCEFVEVWDAIDEAATVIAKATGAVESALAEGTQA